jgi:hypothetical protein
VAKTQTIPLNEQPLGGGPADQQMISRRDFIKTVIGGAAMTCGFTERFNLHSAEAKSVALTTDRPPAKFAASRFGLRRFNEIGLDQRGARGAKELAQQIAAL